VDYLYYISPEENLSLIFSEILSGLQFLLVRAKSYRINPKSFNLWSTRFLVVLSLKWWILLE